jgi:hypothetical protein
MIDIMTSDVPGGPKRRWYCPLQVDAFNATPRTFRFMAASEKERAKFGYGSRFNFVIEYVPVNNLGKPNFPNGWTHHHIQIKRFRKATAAENEVERVRQERIKAQRRAYFCLPISRGIIYRRRSVWFDVNPLGARDSLHSPLRLALLVEHLNVLVVARCPVQSANRLLDHDRVPVAQLLHTRT